MSGTLLESPVNGVDKKISPMSIKKSDDKKKKVTFAEIDADLGQEKDGEESYISQRFMSTDEVFAPVESNYKKIQYYVDVGGRGGDSRVTFLGQPFPFRYPKTHSFPLFLIIT